MPTSVITRVDPLDLQGNIAIGISLPFNGPAGPFNKTYTTKDQIKSNLINLILTNKGERIMNPEFGCDLKRVLFEGIDENITELVQNIIAEGIGIFIPEVELDNILVITADTSSKEANTISINIKYRLRISQEADQVTLEFI